MNIENLQFLDWKEPFKEITENDESNEQANIRIRFYRKKYRLIFALIEDCGMASIKAQSIQVNNYRVSNFWILNFLISYFGLAMGIGDNLIVWFHFTKIFKDE